MTKRCEICGGTETIRLPIRRPSTSAEIDRTEIVSIDDSVRTYPCPECTTEVPIQRVKFTRFSTRIDERLLQAHPEARFYAQKDAAFNLVDVILRRNLIAFIDGPKSSDGRTREIVAVVGVVPKNVVEENERELAADRLKIAREVVVRATREIENWGSLYGHTGIAKDVVYSFLDAALRHAPELAGRIDGKPVLPVENRLPAAAK